MTIARTSGVYLALLVLLTGMATATNHFRPRLSDLSPVIDSKIDIEAEVNFGREVAARILGRFDGLDNADQQRYINLVGRSVARFSGRSDISFRFYVIESDEVNAYAAPGGYIFVTSAAIAAMHDESELAAVLAHEVAHVAKKHIVKALNIKGVDTSASLSQLLGRGNETTRVAFGQAMDVAMDMLFEKGLQTSDEYDADEVALLILAGTGYDPDALPRYLKRISSAKSDTLSTVTDTHPDFNVRLRAIALAMNSHQLNGLDLARHQQRFETEIR